MARQRMIRPEFFLHDELAELSPLHRLLFVGLWTLADREGRLEDRPKRIKVEVLPWDDIDPDAALEDLARAGFILRYQADGRRCIAIPAFARHQKPHPKEAPSTLPSPPSREEVMASREKVLPSRERDMASQSESFPSGSSESDPKPRAGTASGGGVCESNDELFGAGNSLQDALEQRWADARGSPYAWDQGRDGNATRRILALAGGDAREVLRRWDVALATRFPRLTTVADLSRHWNAYAAPEPAAAASRPPERGRATGIPAVPPPPEGDCAVCPAAITGVTWGQELCTLHGAELVDAMGTQPSAKAAARWVAQRRGAA